MSNETFLGFRRPDGRFGIRNYVLILPTSVLCELRFAQDLFFAPAGFKRRRHFWVFCVF
ncbi:altronate hydrolase [Salmonella enterica subsp. enterica serovar Anatum str. USDA 100]|nr:altronate hydrolase [Salmonella enterica subsp. enterica serovar Anatum str. USDA 100]